MYVIIPGVHQQQWEAGRPFLSLWLSQGQLQLHSRQSLCHAI